MKKLYKEIEVDPYSNFKGKKRKIQYQYFQDGIATLTVNRY
ncbi:hypothetical protein [Aquimarina latercula]|nr:hypothetical protein [Aquimarina latercula]